MRNAKLPAPQTVEEYLARVPEPARGTLEKMRSWIRAAAPKDATEGFSYGMPTFFHNGAIVCYAAFKEHCSLFPMGNAAIAEFSEELKPYRTSKGTIQFAADKPLPAALVKKIVKARVAANQLKKTRKKP
jgi:uncharacterized protein YdhG (YjbR/CyaY superfamily)